MSFLHPIPERIRPALLATAVVVVAMLVAAPVRVVSALFDVVRTALGVAIGIGFGLGLAMHVYEHLHSLKKEPQTSSKPLSSTAMPPPTLPSKRMVSGDTMGGPSLLEDGTSYFSLMTLAGYPSQDKVLRAQILKSDASFWNVTYPFTDVPVAEQKGPNLLQSDWPGLPAPVSRELGRFVEHLMRDYVSGWYCRLDSGCVFRDERAKREDGILRDGQRAEDAPPEEQEEGGAPKPRRKMVFSTLTHRRIPMLDQTYKVLSVAFGSLANRAEHVNVFSLALLKWTQVIAHTFKVYRELHKAAQEKNQTSRPSEVMVAKEFLLAGKLHKAITFGLDVPSLLFADAQGTECGTGTDKEPEDPHQVLHERLFNTNLLKECELDYNRVVASRLVRALLPRSESSSQVVMALLVEIFSACVLQPTMNLWVPTFLNELIVNSTKVAEEVNTATEASDKISNDGTEVSTTTAKTNREMSTISDVDSSIAVSEADPSVTLERERTASESDLIEEEGTDVSESEPAQESSGVRDPRDVLLRLVAMSLQQLQQHINLERCRLARQNNQENDVNYDDPACQAAVLRLVMVMEATIMHGRCQYRPTIVAEGEDPPPRGEESLCQLLMEMTSDMNSFEQRIIAMEQNPAPALEPAEVSSFVPEAYEVSTLRTLISTWMHTGQLSKAVNLLTRGAASILRPHYGDDAFLVYAAESFQNQISILEGVDVMVETMAVLGSPPLDLDAEAEQISLAVDTSLVEAAGNHEGATIPEDVQSPSTHDIMAHNFGSISSPRYLNFHKNSAFASSLREERDRRLRAWETQKSDESLVMVHRPGASPDEVNLHHELHSLARTFYNGTNLVSIRDAARKSEQGEVADPETADKERVSLITVETVSVRRRVEVPDDDSSFLLRAQARPLNPVSVHRDDRNHDLSYRCFLATYEEPATTSNQSRYGGGRYIRRCFLQYYPIDRTATIMLHNDARKLDRRKGKPMRQIGQQSQPTPYLSGAFLRERHLCQKWTPKGTTTQKFLSSSVMEATDFNAAPRTGRALDFVFRMSLFDRPAVDLAGKKFLIHDSTAKGHHRSDASALEISDGTLSAMLLSIGREFGRGENDGTGEGSQRIEMGPDGYPMLFMKFSKKTSDEVTTEIKPYRMSFVRAALMVTSARYEAQLQCLTECIKSGSAKSATKARIEAHLRPTLKILDFANDRTNEKLRASTLLRDLKLGVYHIDREQLRRNGLLNPRNPTTIIDLGAKVEGSVQAKDVPEMGVYGVTPNTTLYKIRCNATVQLVEDDDGDLEPYQLEDGSLARIYREEWVVYRSMKDFQAFHKHLKSQVANAEYSASTGSRLVGAATAAFSTGTVGRRNRKALIPSLAQASKTISGTKKAILRRGELLDEYLEYLLTSGRVMDRSMELLLFLGASFPFPPEIPLDQPPMRLVDPLGRTNFERHIVAMKEVALNLSDQDGLDPDISRAIDEYTERSTDPDRANGENPEDEESNLIVSILNKVDQVPLAEVRNRIVELIKYQFGFENASFFRSRMLSALETASFVAMTKGSQFRKLLYRIHIQHLNPEAIAKLIESLTDILWPDGCWLIPRTPFTAEEENELRETARRQLHENFPEQIRTILGRELTRDGLDMVHEMLQNRLVVKSLFYMLFDILWIEVFPELRDALPCASALNID